MATNHLIFETDGHLVYSVATGHLVREHIPITCVTPSFSSGTGTYATTPSVTISTTTTGATIRYTLDGSTPSSTNGTIYTDPVAIGDGTNNSVITLKAIAYKAGDTDSGIASAIYTLMYPVSVTFTGHLKVYDSGSYHYFEAGTYTCTWTGSIYSGAGAIGVSFVSGAWRCQIMLSGGSYWGGGTQWGCASMLGSYSFVQSIQITTTPPQNEEDTVAGLTVSQ